MSRRVLPIARSTVILPVFAVMAAATGCVQRTIRITSEPPGALVWLNDREVGRTPVDVDFVHYGTYDVRLVKEGYEAMLTSGAAKPPIWDNIGLDLVAEVIPLQFESLIEWHYEMEPTETDAEVLRADLLDRAHETRARLEEGDPTAE
jgi:hypothetical protein